MRRAPRPPKWIALITLAALLAGCHRHEGSKLRVWVIGEAPVAAAPLARAATTEGLVALDADGKVVPGLADRWIITDGGLGYIFRLRDADWPDGTPISGESACAALRQALAQLAAPAGDAVPAAGTPPDPSLSADLSGIDEIRAMAGRVLEIRLKHPMPDLLQLLAQPELGLVHKGKGWGPMVVRKPAPAGGNPLQLLPATAEKRGLAADDPLFATLGPLRLQAGDGAPAIAAFTSGAVDVVLNGGFADLPLVARGALGKSLARFDPVLGLFGLVVARDSGILATPRAREALAMAIDRDSIATAFAAAGWVPTTRIVAPGTDDEAGLLANGTAERWAGVDLDSRRAAAAKTLAPLLPASHQPVALTIAMPSGPGAEILFGQLAGGVQALGLTLRRARPGEAPDLKLIDTVARYPRAAWFLDQLSCAALRGPCAPDADALAEQARAAPDAPGAVALWARAEQALAASNLYIPLGAPIRWSLARADLPGFAVNRWGFHALTALAARPR